MRVEIEHRDHVAIVRLTRPDKRNALDLPMFRELVAAGASLQDSDARAVVLCGEGKAFCAGLDIQSIMASGLQDASSELLDHRVGPANLAQRVAWVWRELPVPVIAALHGHAIGGGLQIALGADIRVAHPDTVLAVRELHWGLIPDMGITQTLLGCVRDDVARWLTYTATEIDARQGQQLGLVTLLADDPLEHALELAASIVGRNPHAVRAAKQLFERAPGLDVTASFELETELQRPLLGSPNQIEAVMANMQQRPAKFTD